MTATPIPRTLALTLYGDLDLSVLDELPPGRTPIVTRCVADDQSPKVWEFVRKQVAAGHQAYVVYPVIAENEESELKAAIKMYRELSGKIFADLKVGLAARPPRRGVERAGHAHVSERRVADSGGDHRHRSRRGCAQRDRDGDRARRALWPGAASPVARAHRPRRRPSRIAS